MDSAKTTVFLEDAVENPTAAPRGLTDAQVRERIEKGQVNIASTVKTKSVGRILSDNICTLFNLINVLLFLALISVGSYKNLLFIGVVLFNTVIGVVQEIRSKKIVDSLTILTDSKTTVIRSGEQREIPKEELVLDDIIVLSRGAQVPADCIVIEGTCMANESLLTGEADMIAKKPGCELLSGSYLSAGQCICRVIRVGSQSYAAMINAEAKYIKKNNSQILRSFQTVIRVCTAVIFPLGALLFASKYWWNGMELKPAVESTVGALVGMIPGGMILLTSTVLAVSVIRLAKKQVLVNEMHCIETLARVDVICLDKTGTLTAERMSVSRVIPFDTTEDEIRTALASIAAAGSEMNPTMRAIAEYTQGVRPIGCQQFVPFSSETKRSGGSFKDDRTYFIGAAEFLFSDKEKYSKVFDIIAHTEDIVRFLVLAGSYQPLTDDTPPADLRPMALVLIRDELRENVEDTVRYFTGQGVALKVISGDSVKTVRDIALAAGIPNADKAVDMTTVTDEAQLAEAADRCTVFGRVTPAQKKQLILALKAQGHKVAMTGDGVNDVLALKEADCSVAMISGSEAARNVSQLVLINNDFACMPHVVAEGRRTINNIERSSSLYLVKTIYSILLAFFFLFLPHAYPFQPIQLTLIGSLTVGFPSFVLALQPNQNIVRGSFTFNIITRAAPAAICVAGSILLSSLLSTPLGITPAQLSTIAVYMTALLCLMLIVRLSIPFNALRITMLCLSIAGMLLAVTLFPGFFLLTELSGGALYLFLASAAGFSVLFHVLYSVADRRIVSSY
jgi:cation-transporting ATPase E